MRVMSNNLQKYMKLPKGVVVRVNIAWMNNIKELENIITKNRNRTIFLDYPKGRTKPPIPVIDLDYVFLFLAKYKNIKYFAVSNIETIEEIRDIIKRVPMRIEFVPKIETLRGVNNLRDIIEEFKIRTIMFDKDDLYLDIERNNVKFFECVDSVRKICTNSRVQLLELAAVFFTSKK